MMRQFTGNWKANLFKIPTRLKSKELASHLRCRLKLWSDGDFSLLMDEGRTIQKSLITHPSPSHQKNESIARSFTNLMFAGKVREAIRLLSRNPSGGPLSLDVPAFPDNPGASSVLELLLKHPQPGRVVNSSVLLPETPPPDHSPHFVAYEGIDGLLIRSVALKTFGSAGPSGLWSVISAKSGRYSIDGVFTNKGGQQRALFRRGRSTEGAFSKRAVNRGRFFEEGGQQRALFRRGRSTGMERH